jgi:hypothetical protein
MPYPSVQYKDREEPVKLLANRLFRFKRLVAYGGVAAQYIFSRTTGSIVSPGWAEPVAPPDKSDNRLAADLHVGATYYVTRHIGINAEVAATYNNLPSDSPFSGNVFSYPVTLGVRYRLSEP